MIHISGKVYEMIYENRNGWNPDAFRDRYSEVLDRYDYIVGDWGYNQLRLKGFMKDTHAKATKDSSYSSMSDYINEYCNFGCAYFVLEKVGTSRQAEDDGEPAEGESAIGSEFDTGKISSVSVEDAEQDKPVRLERYDRLNRYDRTDRSERSNPRKDAGDKADRTDRQDKPDNKADKPGKFQKGDKPERPDRTDRNERVDRPFKGDRSQERFDKPERADRSDRQNRYQQRDRKPKAQHNLEQTGDSGASGGPSRKNNRSGGHRGKRPVAFTAKDDVAAASEDNRKPRKDHSRS